MTRPIIGSVVFGLMKAQEDLQKDTLKLMNLTETQDPTTPASDEILLMSKHALEKVISTACKYYTSAEITEELVKYIKGKEKP